MLTLRPLDRRLRFGFAAVCALLLIVGARLVQLQGVDRAGYAVAAAAQRVDTRPLHALRGAILDRNGTVLAYTDSAQDITIDPSQLVLENNDRYPTRAAKRSAYAAQLGPLLGLRVADLQKTLATPGRYAVLAKAVTPQIAKQVEKLGLVGIYTQATTQRRYPGQTTAANIVGLVHADGAGAAGIEYQFNSILAGTDGSLTYSTDNQGNMNPSGPSERKPAQDGGTVRLTIDQDLQYEVQGFLDSGVAAAGARGGQVAILDAATGQVLALAASGTFNAADPSSITGATTLNSPVQTVFEPGSVNKVVTFSAAIEQKAITPSTPMSVPDNIDMGGVNVSDAWGHPVLPYTATGVITQSSNVGTLQIAQKIGPETWDEYEKRFGIGQRTGIELPGESPGILPEMKDWSDASFANLPIGQGEAMTVLQLASMYQTIANDGVRIPPRIVASVSRPDGSTSITHRPDGVRAVSVQTARTVRTMLESVTLPGGTGKKAAIAGYRVAGKTGTAQQPDPDRHGAYSATMNWDTFAGMVPADAPRFVVAIMIDNPVHGLHGGDVAAPLFHDIATYELQHGHVPPTGSQTRYVPLMVCDAMLRDVYGTTVC
ncbi:MAG: penicillin-binding protein 2 [Actinomycetota bacterium]